MSNTRRKRISSPAAVHIVVVLPFLLVIVTQMLFAGFSVHMLSGIRTAITAENLWLQAEQTAVKRLKPYASEGNDQNFREFKAAMGVLAGFNKAGVAEMAGDQTAEEGHFRDAGIPADEVATLVLLGRFSKVSFVAAAMQQWFQANDVAVKLERLGDEIRSAKPWRTEAPAGSAVWLQRVDDLDAEAAPLISRCARSLGDVARLIEHALMTVNLALAVGLAMLTVWRVRRFLVQRRAIESALSWQASHDSLTGIANRLAFESRLDDLTADSAGNRPPFAVMFIDLDQFKVVNDTCGHSAGDALLRRVAAAVQREIRPMDLLARLGGDEFSVLMADCSLQQTVDGPRRSGSRSRTSTSRATSGLSGSRPA